MKFVVEDISPIKKKIRVEVPQDDVAKERDKAFANVARKAKIPGFRPGKAPRAVLERHYAEEVQADVMNKLIPLAYFTAVREHHIHPVEAPEISDVSMVKGQPFSFSATVEVRPEITLGAYEGIEVKEGPITVTDDEVKQTIERLREMYAQLEVVDGRAVEKGDTVTVDFEGFMEGKPIEGAKAAGHMVTLGSGNLIPGFEEQIAGMNKDETKEIRVTFPADYNRKELAGKDATFKVTVKEIKRAALPELNDDFAQDIGGHKTVEELRSRIREDLEIRKRNEQLAGQREQLMSRLIETHSFEIPPSLVDQELQDMVKDQTMRLTRQGMDVKAFDEAKFREQNRALAETRVKGMLILDAISEKEKVEATDEEVTAKLAEMARVSGRPLEAVRKYYESSESGLDHLRSGIVQEKTMALLLSRAKKVYN